MNIMSILKTNASLFVFKTINHSYSQTGNQLINFQLESRKGHEYSLIDNDLRLLKGKYTNRVKLTLSNYDYTGENIRRKVEWKLIAGDNHLSKLYPVQENIFRIDFIDSNDAAFIYWVNDFLKILVLPGLRNDYTLNDDVYEKWFDIDFINSN